MKTEYIILADQQGRQRIQSDIQTNLIVEAGAGSGKTTEMANRIVALLVSGYRTIGEIAAITFTNKAANELQHRVHARLESVYEESGDEKIRHALDNYHLCFIGTIHSFCSKLLRERPIEACVDPSFEEIEEAEDFLIRNKIWQDYVFSADEEVKKLLDVLSVLNINVEALKNFLKIVCDNQDVVFNFHHEEQVDMTYIGDQIHKVFTRIDHFMRSVKDDLPEGLSLDSDDLDGLQKSVLTFFKKTKNRQELSLEEKVNLLNRMTSSTSCKVVQKRWSDDPSLKKKAKEMGLEMDDLRQSLILPLFEAIKIYAYNHVFIPFVERTQPDYTGYKKKTGKMNFQDLLIDTNQMLKNSVDVRRHFQGKYKTLLVDEFQDTDPIQAQMLMYLTGKELNEKRWDHLTPNEGALFVVGDPKQSIYAFRRADIEIYEKFKQLVIQRGGALVELTTNFRASQTLGTWYNEIFSQVFQGSTQAKFSHLHAINAALDHTFDGVSCKKIAAKKKEEIEELEVQSIKEMIEQLVGNQTITTSRISTEEGQIKLTYSSRKIQYKDIMILTMKKAQLTRVSSALAYSGLKVKAVGADIVQQTPTFKSLAQIIKMFARPEENAQLYGVMISEPFEFKDDELTRFKNMGGYFNIHSDLQRLIEEKKENSEDLALLLKVKRTFDLLKKLNQYAKELPAAAFIEKLAEELGLQEKIALKPKAMIEMSSFSSLMEQLRLKPLQDLWGMNVLLDQVSNLLETGMDKELDLEGGDYDAIRVMNVHKCKGLEAPIIILAGSYSGDFPNPSLYIERTHNEKDEVFFKGHISLTANPDKMFNKDRICSNDWRQVEKKSIEKHREEFDRLVYVAATRARNALIVMSSESPRNPWDMLSGKISRTVEEALDFQPAAPDQQAVPRLITSEGDKKEDSESLSLKAIEAQRHAFFNENLSTYRSVNPSKSQDAVLSMTGYSDEQEVTVFDSIDMALDDSPLHEKEWAAMDLGTSIHRLFEALIKGSENMEDYIWHLAEDYPQPDFMAKLFKNALNQFCKSKLYSRLKNAEEVHCEVPFAYKIPQTNEQEDTYVNGIIDLIFKEQGEWKIVDYKTCDKSHDHQALYQLYKGQLEAYKEAWKACTGCQKVSAELFFIEK